MKAVAIGNLQHYQMLLTKLVNMVLIALIGVTLGRVFWTLMPTSSAAAKMAAVIAPSQPADNARDSNLPGAITGAHLFGTATRAAPQPVQAPETNLALTLTGILFSRTPHDSVAIIANNKNNQQFYQPGDQVEQGVSLHAIYSGRVILKRAGKLETLKLDQGGLSTANHQANGAPAGDKPDLAQVRHKLLQNPGDISQYVRLQPVYKAGQLRGYRIYPNQHRAAFAATGLQPGDLVKAINGVPLNNPSKAMGALSELGQASSIRIKLNRLGRDKTLTVAFQ